MTDWIGAGGSIGDGWATELCDRCGLRNSVISGGVV